MTPSAVDVDAALAALAEEVGACTRCSLHATRTRAVPGEGDPRSELMFVGEAPGYHEDQQGRPFVGQAGQLLEDLLASIGLTRRQVFIANVLKCRPPNNRDPIPDEIAACESFLHRQIQLVQPKVVCTLGNHATKLLSGSPAGITRVHGRSQTFAVGDQAMYLYPIFHPAAALYTRAMLATLQEDVLRLPGLLARPRPGADTAAASAASEHGGPMEEPPPARASSEPTVPQPPSAGHGEQLGLF